MLEAVISLWQWCLPKTCLICGFNSIDPYSDLCTFCSHNLPWLKDACSKCSGKITIVDGVICSHCRDSTLPFDKIYALFDYKTSIARIIKRMKFSRQIYLVNMIAKLFSDKISKQWYVNSDLPQVLIPMPITELEYNTQGFNQIQAISKPLARTINMPIDLQVCARTANGFAIDKHQYNYVAILVDVIKSGKTIRALCILLQKSGVQNIDVWCIAI